MSFVIEPKRNDKYDVVVCGAGTAGVIAAISAARQGASVLLIERSFKVGGMLTEGNAGITKFTEHCKDHSVYKEEVLETLKTNPEKVLAVNGIPREFCKNMISAGAGIGTYKECGGYVFTETYKAQGMLLKMLKESGAEILFDTRVCHANVKDNKLCSVVAVNKDGFTEFFAKSFIDCTGDADVAALSGVDFVLGATEDDIAEGGALALGQMQPMGVMYRVKNVNYENMFKYLKENPDAYEEQAIGLLSIDEVIENHKNKEMCVFNIKLPKTDPDKRQVVVQVYNTPTEGEAILLACAADYNAYQGDGTNAASLSNGQASLISGSLEFTEIMKNTIPGFECVSVAQIPDIGVRETRHIIGKYKLSTEDVMLGRDFEDSVACGAHIIDSDTVSEEARNMSMYHWRFHIPYRTMLPEKIKNLIVAGRAISASKMASGAVRVTATCMALGEAAGIAAYMASKDTISPDEIDVNVLRNKLLENNAVI